MTGFVPFARTPNLGGTSSRPGVSVDNHRTEVVNVATVGRARVARARLGDEALSVKRP
jgi:hypothetical protein